MQKLVARLLPTLPLTLACAIDARAPDVMLGAGGMDTGDAGEGGSGGSSVPPGTTEPIHYP